MSRNFPYTATPAPIKIKVKRKTSVLDYSSDDDYAGVDQITDSEEDEEDVTEVEERAILESEQDGDDDEDTPRPTQEDEEDSPWEGFGDSQSVLGDDIQFFEDHMARMEEADLESAIAASSMASDDDQLNKKVRFALSSEDEEEDEDNNFGFPDIFVPQSELATSFRKQIEQEYGSEDSFWEHGDKSTLSKEMNESNSSDSSDDDSDLYDSDDNGETTDEDVELLSRCVPTKSVLQRPNSDSGSEEEINMVRAPIRRSQGPKLGVWTSTPGKPFLIMDQQRKVLKVFGRRRNNIHSDTRPTQSAAESPMQAMQEMSPMISNSANLMMSSMDGWLHPTDLFQGNILGPPEAFFPFTSISPNGEVSQDEPSSYDGDDLDDEDLWTVDDFLQFGPDTSSDEDAPEDNGETSSTLDGDVAATPRPTTAGSESQHQFNPLLSNPALVGAFRSNQHRHKILSGNSNTTENSLLFSTGINSTAISGIKKGRIAAATAPIATPRKRSGQPCSVELSSPAAIQGQKRNFSGDTPGHKRLKRLN